MVYAERRTFSTWGSSLSRSRHDYDSKSHLLAEMTDPGYWGPVIDQLRATDLIYVTDAANQRATYVVADVDTTSRMVRLDLDITHSQTPIVDASGYAIRNRGPRGGKFCVVTGDGEIIARDIETRHEAERQLANLIESRERPSKAKAA